MNRRYLPDGAGTASHDSVPYRGIYVAVALQLVLAVVVVAGLLLVSREVHRERIESETSLLVSETTSFYRRVIDSTALSLENAAARLAIVPERAVAGDPELQQVFRRIVDRLDTVSVMLVLDETGVVRIDSRGDAGMVGASLAGRAVFTESRAAPVGSTFFGDPGMPGVTGHETPALLAGTPLYPASRRPGDQPTGVIVAAIDSAVFADGLPNARVLSGYSLHLVNRDGRVVSSVGSRPIAVGTRYRPRAGDRISRVRQAPVLEKVFRPDPTPVAWLPDAASPIAVVLVFLLGITTLAVEILMWRSLSLLARHQAAALRVKTTLLQEIHHRVKNNLQVMTSLLNLQAHEYGDDPRTRRALDNAVGRITTMSLVHEMMYRDENPEHINMFVLTNDIVTRTGGSTNPDERNGGVPPVSIISAEHASVDHAPTGGAPADHSPAYDLPLDRAVPVGLMLYEIITNAVRHGAGDPTVHVLFAPADPDSGESGFSVVVGDSGLDPQSISSDSLEPWDDDDHDGLGILLVRSLASQASAEADRFHVAGAQGTLWRVLVPGSTL